MVPSRAPLNVWPTATTAGIRPSRRPGGAASDEPDGMIERPRKRRRPRRPIGRYGRTRCSCRRPRKCRTCSTRSARPRSAPAAAHVVNSAAPRQQVFRARALRPSIDLRWTVVELARHVEHGRAHFDPALRFETRLEDAARPTTSSPATACPLPDPVAGARALARTGAAAIVLDRILLPTNGRADRAAARRRRHLQGRARIVAARRARDRRRDRSRGYLLAAGSSRAPIPGGRSSGFVFTRVMESTPA